MTYDEGGTYDSPSYRSQSLHSSVGRAEVSKTFGRKFESFWSDKIIKLENNETVNSRLQEKT
jgi:hypothetical protein